MSINLHHCGRTFLKVQSSHLPTFRFPKRLTSLSITICSYILFRFSPIPSDAWSWDVACNDATSPVFPQLITWCAFLNLLARNTGFQYGPGQKRFLQVYFSQHDVFSNGHNPSSSRSFGLPPWNEVTFTVNDTFTLLNLALVRFVPFYSRNFSFTLCFISASQNNSYLYVCYSLHTNFSLSRCHPYFCLRTLLFTRTTSGVGNSSPDSITTLMFSKST